MPAVGGEVLLSGGQLGPDLLTLGSGLPASLLWLCKVPEHLTSLHESHPWRTCLHELPPAEGGSKTRDDGVVSGPGFAWADKGKAEIVAHVEVLLCPLDSKRVGLAWRQSPSSMQKIYQQFHFSFCSWYLLIVGGEKLNLASMCPCNKAGSSQTPDSSLPIARSFALPLTSFHFFPDRNLWGDLGLGFFW